MTLKVTDGPVHEVRQTECRKLERKPSAPLRMARWTGRDGEGLGGAA